MKPRERLTFDEAFYRRKYKIALKELEEAEAKKNHWFQKLQESRRAVTQYDKSATVQK